MDSLASLALATETPTPALLRRPPYRKTEYIISQKMVKHILGQGVFQSIAILVLLFCGQTFIKEKYNVAGDEANWTPDGDPIFSTPEMLEMVRTSNNELYRDIYDMLTNPAREKYILCGSKEDWL